MKNLTTLPKVALGAFILLIGLVLVGFYNPPLFLVVINIFWLVIFVGTLAVIIVGILTVLGRKKEAGKILDLMLEGSLSFIDLAKFTKDLFESFKHTLTDIAVAVIPNLSIVIAVFTYLFVIIIYKFIGKYGDVTVPTIIFTVVLTFLSGIFTLPREEVKFDVSTKIGRIKVAFKEFKQKFVDYFEIAVFVLFLTIDSTKLFFLPAGLNVPINAQLGEYDLMVRGFDVTDHFGFTGRLIIFGFALELLRNVIRLVSIGRKFYNNPQLLTGDEHPRPMGRAERLKLTVRKTFAVSKDEFLMFAAFTTLIIFVFLFFPRLKLLALITASLTGLILDMLFTERLGLKEREDLISRTFQKLVQNP